MNLAVIVLAYIISYASSDQIIALDDPNFASLGRHFAGTPWLLTSLATKEEVIRMLLSNFQQELGEDVKTKTTRHALSHSGDGPVDLVDSYLRNYDETSGNVSSEFIKQKTPLRPQHVAWNPLSTYHMIRRFSKDLKALLQSLDLSDMAHLRTYNYIMQVMKGLGWPSEEDLKNQMSSILRVQHVYDLQANELATGKIHDRFTNVELRWSDCYAIGKHALATNFYALAIEWLEIAVHKLKNESTLMRQRAEAELEHAIMVHDLLWEKAQRWDPLYYVNKVSDQQQGHKRLKRRKAHFDDFKGPRPLNTDEIKFCGLCSGENYQDREEKKKLFCYYESRMSKNAWAIGPVKVEILSVNPLIVQYYDMIGDRMIERIKREAESSLAPSTIVDNSVGADKLSDVRTSTNTWIPDHILQGFTSIQKRISAITGMNVNGVAAAEELQVASYAFGGHYGVHLDFANDPTFAGDRGDRIATFMFYLSDVEKGGSTAFPLAGVAATPVKGSAVYWYNLLSSGDGDQRTWHGACPVILGEKWVSNKWIRQYEQMRTYQCDPAGRVPIRFEVNGKPLVFDDYKEELLLSGA